jgi:hypothetical protein
MVCKLTLAGGAVVMLPADAYEALWLSYHAGNLWHEGTDADGHPVRVKLADVVCWYLSPAKRGPKHG